MGEAVDYKGAAGEKYLELMELFCALIVGRMNFSVQKIKNTKKKKILI